MTATLTPEQQAEREKAAIHEIITRSKTDIRFFAKTIFNASLRPKQVEFAEAFMNNQRISFRGGTGFGKTYVIALLTWWSLFCHDNIKVVLFGPTEDQLKGALWNEIRTFFDQMHPAFKPSWDVTSTKVERVSNPNSCYAEYRLASKTNPAAARGIHAKNVFLICDEADGVPDEIIELMTGIFSDENPKLALISNPTKLNCYFWRTHCDENFSKIWTKIHGKATDNPNLTPQALQNMILEKGGPLSRETRSMIWGEFPEEEFESLIPFQMVQAAIENEDVVETPGSQIVWGLDPAGDTNQDKTVLCIRRDNLVKEFKTWEGLNPTQISYAVRDLYLSTPKAERPVSIAVDVIGVGAGVGSNLKEFGLPVREVKVSNKPTRQPERWASLKEQLWFEARDWFASENVKIPDIKQLLQELTVHTYELTTGGKHRMESKKDVIRKRLKGKSPDYADALILTFAVTAIRSAGKYSFKTPIEYKNLGAYE